MITTLLSLFEQNEQKFKEELSLMLLPRDSGKLQKFMNDFFVNKVSFDEYKKELTLGEIALLNSVMKVVVLPISLVNANPALKGVSDISNKNVSNTSSSFDFFDINTLGGTAVGGLVGSLLFKTWGGVLLSIAGCALGMYFSPSSSKAKGESINKGLDVDIYIQTLKGICSGIDDVIKNYHTSIDNILKQQENQPKVTLATAYKPLLDRMASLFVAVESVALPSDVKSEFDKLFRTLKNHHYEVLGFNDSTKEYYTETESPHVTEETIVKAAILENGKLLEKGECLIPEK